MPAKSKTHLNAIALNLQPLSSQTSVTCDILKIVVF
jgi:hypothetical protein